MRSSEADEIEARLARARKLEDDLDARLALVIARQQERQGVIKDLEAERREAIATGKHGRASAAASGSPQPPISDAAGDDESSKDCPGQVEPSFDSSEVDRLDCVAKCLRRPMRNAERRCPERCAVHNCSREVGPELLNQLNLCCFRCRETDGSDHDTPCDVRTQAEKQSRSSQKQEGSEPKESFPPTHPRSSIRAGGPR